MTDSLFIRACRKESVPRAPIWLMRQAGRYLPEYRELRSKQGLLDLMRSADLAAEVTLQPLRRMPLDAGIIFADILTPLIGMGVTLEFLEGEGPRITPRIERVEDVSRLRVPSPEENVGYTLEAIRLVVRELSGRTPLIGFSGAPFTLASYLIEGESSSKCYRTKRFMVSEPLAWADLQEKLVTLVSDYLVAQVDAGAAALQLFDSWLGAVSPELFRSSVLPFVQRIVRTVREKTDVPVIYFAPGSAGIFPHFAEIGADVLGVDWRMRLMTAHALVPDVGLQGNFDPSLLHLPWERIREMVGGMLAEGRTLPGYVCNVGHGLLPDTNVATVEAFVEYVTGVEGR